MSLPIEGIIGAALGLVIASVVTNVIDTSRLNSMKASYESLLNAERTATSTVQKRLDDHIIADERDRVNNEQKVSKQKEDLQNVINNLTGQLAIVRRNSTMEITQLRGQLNNAPLSDRRDLGPASLTGYDELRRKQQNPAVAPTP